MTRRIGRYDHLPAACPPHDRRAPEVARGVSEMIRGPMPGLTVEHVGSTAPSRGARARAWWTS